MVRQPPPILSPGETVTRRTSGFGVATTLGTLATLGTLGAAIGITIYNQQWIDEYNQYAAAFEYYRTRNASLALQYQAQGREHLRVIEENETLATALYVSGGIAAAATLGMLIFWPRETVPADRAALRLRVLPTPGGFSLSGAF